MKSWLPTLDEMTNLSKGLSQKLQGDNGLYVAGGCRTACLPASTGLKKYLFRAFRRKRDRKCARCSYHHGNSVCISSQVGCRMGCRFCASTLGRTDAESDSRLRCWIRSTQIQQVSGERVSNVVVMGTGEPLDNYDNLLKFIRLLTDEEWAAISAREISPYLPAAL